MLLWKNCKNFVLVSEYWQPYYLYRIDSLKPQQKYFVIR